MTTHLAARALLVLLALAACGDATGPEKIPPVATTVNARVMSPNQDDGAVMIEINGEVRTVTPASGTVLYIEPAGAVTRILGLRSAAGPAEWFTVVVAPGSAQLAPKVIAAASLQDVPREDVSAYKVEMQ